MLLIDEVLAVGDQAFRGRCLERLRELQRQGVALVVVSHDMETIQDLCSRAVWLERGRVRLEGPARKVVAAYEEGGADR